MAWTSLTVGLLLISPGLVYADASLSVGFGVAGAGSCGSSLSIPAGNVFFAPISSTADSERLDVGPCTPAALTQGPPIPGLAAWVAAAAQPFTVALAGEPGYIPAIDSSITISASAEWDGEFEAYGGTGSAFIDFQLEAPGGYEEFGCEFLIPSLGIDTCPPGPSVSFDLSFTIPVTFNDPIAYTLLASQTLSVFDSNSEYAALSMINFSVVDASGNPIPGAFVGEAPEPSAIWLLGIAALLALPRLSRSLKSHSV